MVDQDGVQPEGTATAPPELWDPSRFGKFRSEFSAAEQQELLHEDTDAQTQVCMILTALIAIGLVLAGISVVLIAYVVV